MRSIIESAHASEAKLRRRAGAARNSRARRVAPGRAQDRLHQPQHLAALRGLRAYLGDGIRPHLDRIRKQSGRCAPGRFVSTPNRARDLLQAARHAPLRKQRRPAGGDRMGGSFGGDRPVRPAGLENKPRALHFVQRPAWALDPRQPDADRPVARCGGPAAPDGNDLEEGRRDRRPRPRRDRAGKPARRARSPCAPALDAAGGAAARGGRNHQYRHSHGRAPGRPGEAWSTEIQGLPLSGMRLAFT